MPAISKTDLLPVKTEPITDSGSASGITYLRKGKNTLSNNRQREE